MRWSRKRLLALLSQLVWPISCSVISRGLASQSVAQIYPAAPLEMTSQLSAIGTPIPGRLGHMLEEKGRFFHSNAWLAKLSIRRISSSGDQPTESSKMDGPRFQWRYQCETFKLNDAKGCQRMQEADSNAVKHAVNWSIVHTKNMQIA